MKLSYKQYSFSYICILCVAVSTLSAFCSHFFMINYITNNTIQSIKDIGRLIADDSLSIYLGRGNIVHLEDALNRLSDNKNIEYAYIIESNKIIVAASKNLPIDIECCYNWEPKIDKNSSIDKGEGSLTFKANEDYDSDDIHISKEQTFILIGVKIVEHSSKLKIGDLIMVLNKTEINTNVQLQSFKIGVLLFIILLGFCTILAYFLSNRLSLPLENICRKIKYLETSLTKIRFFSNNLSLIDGNIPLDNENVTKRWVIKIVELDNVDIALNKLWSKFYSLINRELKLKNELIEAKRHEAIAHTTQMLAHDVRKPFSMLNGMLSILESINDMTELRKTVKQYMPDVKRALTSANAMINDVMEVGRNTKLKQEPVGPESLIEASLVEVCHMHRQAIVNIKYDLNHNHMVNVDSLRLQRVFSNIINNAIEAMDDHCGSMWISTNEDINSQFTTFCIGNNKSFIPKKEVSKLFDTFYTKNKQGGTGLGLAIAQKVISAHGGKIWCESSKTKQTVEFFFTLPVAKDNLNVKTSILPSNTKSIVERFEKSTIGREDESLDDRHDLVIQACEKAIIEKANDFAQSIKLGIVDDEVLYRNALNDLIIRSKNLKKFIEIHQFPDSDSVLKACEVGLLDILICDVDLGRKSLNGFDIVKEIRKRGDDIPICIHSNRCSPDHYEQAVKLGAQAFISKPMNRTQILKFITNSIKDKKFDKKTIKKKTTIVVIDDEMIYLQLWQYTLKQNEAQLYTYSSLDSFYKALDEDQSFVDRIDCIIVDRYFPEGDCIELGFTSMCRVKYKYKGLLFLSSNAYANNLATEAGFDSLIPKKPESWETLKTFFH